MNSFEIIQNFCDLGFSQGIFGFFLVYFYYLLGDKLKASRFTNNIKFGEINTKNKKRQH